MKNEKKPKQEFFSYELKPNLQFTVKTIIENYDLAFLDNVSKNYNKKQSYLSIVENQWINLHF